MLNENDGVTHDFTRKEGVIYSEVMIPPQANEKLRDRSILWNEVEKVEVAKNSQLAREVEIALPRELNKEEQIQLVKEYVQENFVKNGMCADINIHSGHKHDKDKNKYDDKLLEGDIQKDNPHAHIMLTVRPIKENGDWGAKSKEEKVLDKDGNIQRTKAGRILSKKVETTTWNTKEFLLSYREDWANKINEKLKEKGINERVDHRSYKEQGIEKTPTIHEGYVARAMEKRGQVSERMEINRDIKNLNKEIEALSNDIERLSEQKGGFELMEIREQIEKERAELERLRNEKSELEKLNSQKDTFPNNHQQQSNGALEEIKEKRLEIDDQETRKIQRNEGLSRVDEVTAQSEELGLYDKKKGSTEDIHPLNESSKTYTLEETGNKLNELKDKYIDLEKQINQGNKNNSEIQNTIRQTQGQINDINKIKSTVDGYQKQGNSLQEQRNDLGIFKVKEKKEIDNKISQVRKSEEQAKKHFEQQFNKNFDLLEQQLKELHQDLIKANSKTPVDVGALKEQQKEISYEYKKEKVLAEQQLDPNVLKDYLKEIQPNKTHEKASINDRMAIGSAESKLNNVSKEDLKKISKDVSAEQGKQIEEKIQNMKEHNISHER